MRILIISVFFLFTSVLFSQEQIKVSLVLLDDATKAELESCLLKITGNNVNKTIGSFNSGDTIVINGVSYNDELLIQASTQGYSTLKKKINLQDFKREIRRNKLFEVKLDFKYGGQDIVEFDVNAKKKPVVVFSSDTISVSDFKIIDENNLILLTYPKRLEKSSEIVWFQNGKVQGRVDNPCEAIELISDYKHNIYLSCKESTYKVTAKSRLKLQAADTKGLENNVLPIIDTLEEEHVYFSNYNRWYPAFDYFMVTRTDTQYTKVRHIEDSEMMEQYRAEYKWADVRTKLWAWDMEAESGIDREVWVGANIFTNSIYYEEPYSPMFLVNEELILFDLYNDILCRLDAYNCEVFDSLPIQFHQDRRKTNWERKIIQDPITKKLYALYDHVGNTSLREIDYKTGELSKEVPLYYRYTEHVTVYDNKIYYIYRPFESMQKKYLYVQEMDLMSGG